MLFFDLQPPIRKIPSHFFFVELKLFLKLWRQTDETHKCLEHRTSEHNMEYIHLCVIKASVCLMLVFIHPICLLLRTIGCGSLHKMSFLVKPLTISSHVGHPYLPTLPLPAPCKHVTVNIELSS